MRGTVRYKAWLDVVGRELARRRGERRPHSIMEPDFVECAEDEDVLICRDDRCTIEEVHGPHPIFDGPDAQRQRRRTLGWSRHPLEHEIVPGRESNTALDECIITSVSKYTPKCFSMIRIDIESSFGSCAPRRLFRRLKTLSTKGAIIRIDLSAIAGALFSAYVAPGSRLIKEPMLVYQQLIDWMDFRSDEAREAKRSRNEDVDVEDAEEAAINNGGAPPLSAADVPLLPIEAITSVLNRRLPVRRSGDAATVERSTATVTNVEPLEACGG